MHEVRKAIHSFIVSSLQARLGGSIPPKPTSPEELATRVADALIYLGYLPQVFGVKVDDGANSEEVSYQDVARCVADEVYVAILEYFNSDDKPNPRFPMHAMSRLTFN